jgi:hydrogenase maturation factor
MNYSTAVFLINKHVRAVAGTYEAGETAKKTLFKTLDETIKVGDFVVVPTDTRHEMTVVKIVDVDVDVDFDSPVAMGWVISKVDREEHQQVLAQEAEAIQKIKTAELRDKRAKLAESLLSTKSLDDLKSLPIATMNGDAPAVEPPKA